MRVVLDTNVLIDAIAERGDYPSAQKLILCAAEDRIEGLITANTVTDIHYILKKRIGDRKTREAIRHLLQIFTVTAIDGAVCDEALDLPMRDYEDAVLAVSAREAGADCIATGDQELLKEPNTPVRAMRVKELLEKLDQEAG